MKNLKLLLDYAEDYVGQLVVTVLTIMLLVGARLLAPWIIKTMIGAVKDQARGETPAGLIPRLALLALIVYLVRGGIRYLRSYIAHLAGWGVVADARQDVYEHLQRLSLRFHEDRQTGELMSRLLSDSNMFERLIAHAIPDAIANVLMLVGVSVVLIRMNWRLMLLSLIPVPVIVLGTRAFSGRMRPAFRERQEERGELNATLNDNLSGIREIKAFAREPEEALTVSERIDSFLNSNLKALSMMAGFRSFVEFASSLGTIVVIYFGGRLAMGQMLSIENLVAFFLYLDMFYRPLRVLSRGWEHVQEALAGAERVAELLEERPDIRESCRPVELPDEIEGDIVFRDVSFSYESGQPVLEDIDLHVPAHSVVALVGPTGVGKTTLASLVPRFYDVREGSVTLDGYDVRDLKLRGLRRQIGIVLQDAFLFHGTARENILFGRPDAAEKEVIKAAKVANAHEFIAELPDGYDTIIGERGVKLSGGQQQRLAIARAVLKDAPILILDEATSSVDTQTERLIQQALGRLMVGRTAIIIAHRLSTIRNAALIVVLEGTHITEMGTHEELMARDGLYRHLNEIQTEPELVPA